jgi:predicted ATPase
LFPGFPLFIRNGVIFMLSSFTVENYRAFAREQTIEIRPLTLFFGWNSSGKSTLVRFLPLLVESIKADGQTISLTGEVCDGAAWPEVVCKATKRSSFKFGLHWDGQTPLTAKWEVDGDLAGTWQDAKYISMKNSFAEMTWTTNSNMSDRWAGYPNGEPSTQTGEKTAFSSPDQQFQTLMRSLLSNLQWIRGVRVRPPRWSSYSGGNPPVLQPDGSNAIDHLIAAQLRSVSDPVLGLANAFFTTLGEQLAFENPVEGFSRVMLRPTNAPDVKINLRDTGEGYTQVLPVLIALARARSGGPRLLCLEQPELHLHTRAQVELAKLLVQTAVADSKPSILVETHSEVLLTSVQLAIANGEIAPEMVRVYWVESRPDGTSDVFPVDFDAQGMPTSMELVGAFSEAVDLGQALMVKQLAGQIS